MVFSCVLSGVFYKIHKMKLLVTLKPTIATVTGLFLIATKMMHLWYKWRVEF